MIIADTASPIAHPNAISSTKNAISGKPSEKIEYWNSTHAKMHAPPTPISVRNMLITSWPAMNSRRRNGLTNRLPRLREYISSMKVSETPSWPRKSTSQRSTAPMKNPGASFRKLFVGAR